MKFIDPRIDFAFKKIFGSDDAKDILISFLESLLGLEGDKRILEVTIIDPFLAPRIREMKESALDIRCKDLRGIHYIVEMQVQKTHAFLKRIQFNAAKAYVNQISSGEEYPKLNQVIAITITDFTLFNAFDHAVSQHQIQETITSQPLMQEVVYWFIELSKFHKKLEELDNVRDQWIYFIKTAALLEDIPTRFLEEPFRHAFEKARMANMDKEELEYYDKAGMAIADARGAIELALDEGEQIGIVKGEHKHAIATLLRLLEYKFGDLLEHHKETINAATLPTLEMWSLRLLDAQSIDDVINNK